jgi:hypothetical protein
MIAFFKEKNIKNKNAVDNKFLCFLIIQFIYNFFLNKVTDSKYLL